MQDRYGRADLLDSSLDGEPDDDDEQAHGCHPARATLSTTRMPTTQAPAAALQGMSDARKRMRAGLTAKFMVRSIPLLLLLLPLARPGSPHTHTTTIAIIVHAVPPQANMKNRKTNLGRKDPAAPQSTQGRQVPNFGAKRPSPASAQRPVKRSRVAKPAPAAKAPVLKQKLARPKPGRTEEEIKQQKLAAELALQRKAVADEAKPRPVPHAIAQCPMFVGVLCMSVSCAEGVAGQLMVTAVGTRRKKGGMLVIGASAGSVNRKALPACPATQPL